MDMDLIKRSRLLYISERSEEIAGKRERVTRWEQMSLWHYSIQVAFPSPRFQHSIWRWFFRVCVCRWHSQIALLCIFRLKGFAPRFTSATRTVSVLASVCTGGTVQTVAKYLHHFAVLSLVYFSETALTRLIKIKLNMQPQLDFPISTRSLSRFIPISIRRTSLEAEQT